MLQPSSLALLCLVSLGTLVPLTGGQTLPEDLFSIRKFENSTTILGLPGQLFCYADSTVQGVNIRYEVVRTGQPDYLTNEMETGRVSVTARSGQVFVDFAPVRKIDEGEYTCTAWIVLSDGSTPITAQTKTASLIVDETSIAFLNDPAPSLTVAPGEDLAVSACYTNQEEDGRNHGNVTVSWALNGQELDLTRTTAFAYSTGVFTVRDYSVFDQPFSNFTCSVLWQPIAKDVNDDTLSRSFSVSIDGSPRLLGRRGYIYYYNITVDGVTAFTVPCNMILPFRQLGAFTTFTWYYPQASPQQSRQEVPRTVSTNSPYVDSQSRLVVTDAHPDHSGLYTCTGSNVFGSNSSYSNVTIVYPAPIIWVQFYMIIIYVVVVLAVIILFVALCVRFCCLGFCYVREKKVVVDSTFYTTSKFKEVEEKKALQDRTEFQEVNLDMQLAGVQMDDSGDEGMDAPDDDDYKPKPKGTVYEGMDINMFPWDDENETSKLHRTDPEQMVIEAKPRKQRPRRQKPKQAYVELHPPQEEPRIEVQPKPEPEPQPVETPESQRKVDITQVVPVVSPIVKLSEKPKEPKAPKAPKVVKAEEDERPLIEEDAISGAESQVFEATFGMSDLESEDPPDSDFSM